jgi:hypothetical protein
MTRFFIVLGLVLTLPGIGAGQTGNATAAKNPTKQAQTSSFIDKVLQFLGISDSPGTLKGPGDDLVKGQLWVVDLDSKHSRAATGSAGFRSPVFIPGSHDILALSGSDVWRIPAASSGAAKLYSVDAVTKLVAFSSRDPDKLLILQRDVAGGHPRVGLLSVSAGKVIPLSYDPASHQDLQMIEGLEGWTRTYGDTRVYVGRQSKPAMSGTIEWTDVFLTKGSQPAEDVSQCDGTNCGQPSMSPDGKLVVFVKAETE